MNAAVAATLLALVAPISVFAFSTGPPIKRTGASIDGGNNCSVCHATYGSANSDPRGSVKIDVLSYVPGVTQTIQITVSHPEAVRWGFQITARMANDPSQQAGTFAPNSVVRVRCDTSPAHDAPCDGAREFPEHISAPRSEAGAGFTFSVDWTPPSTDQGDVVFYAAGNAANGDGNLTGDRIYTTTRVVSPVCALTGKPTIKAVVNAASYGATLASNTMLAIFGTRFTAAGVKRQVGADDIATYHAFPQQLACLAVEIDGKRAPISYADGGQMNVQAPSTSTLGLVSVRVIANPDQPASIASDAVAVQMLAAAPAFFTLDGKNLATSAKPGDMVVFYGTGFGPTDPAVAAGDLATDVAALMATPTVMIGGVVVPSTDLAYVGLTPGYLSGLYQVNVRVPATIPDGNAAVSLQIGSQKTQDGVILAIKR